LKILLVGMADSVHFSRWLSQFDSSSIEFEIVSSSPHRKIHSEIRKRLKDSPLVSMTWLSQKLSLPMWIFDRFLSDWIRGFYVAYRILRFKPDIVHVHELQNAGYLTRRAYQLLRTNLPKLIVTNYGSEIVWFSKYSSHKKKLRELLDFADGFTAECTRDYILASQLSPKIKALPLMPVAGGLTRNTSHEIPRLKIAIKGYENHWGKAIVVLETLCKMSNYLTNFEIVLYSCNSSVIRAAKKIRKANVLTITSHKKGALSHGDILEIFRSSIIYIGHSLSDGISTSMLEAMAMGAVPIQTNTSCASEWIQDNSTGFLIEPNDMEALSKAIELVLSGEFDSALSRDKNYAVIQDRYNPGSLSKIASGYYKLI